MSPSAGHARVAVITGASGGIGLATAHAMVERGFSLRIVGRNPKKLARATEELSARGGDVVPFQADFSSLAEVRGLSTELLALDEPLHVLINNAGVWHPDYRMSRDGYEDTFAVNHLAPFLLTRLLLPRMRETTGDRRIVHVSSRLHLQSGQTATLWGRLIHSANVLGLPLPGPEASLDFDRLVSDSRYKGLEAYARSKLAQVIYSNELARREPEVTTNAVHPGSVLTDVQRDNRVLSLLAPLARPVLKTPEQGAATSVHVATAPELKGVTGRYFADCKEKKPAGITQDREVGRRLWELSEELISVA